MWWPQAQLPVFAEIAPGAASAGDPSGAAFTEVSSDLFKVADQIAIGWGRGDWGKNADAGTAEGTFDNRSGDYSAANPLGQWYGQLGKDTPFRCGLIRALDTFSTDSAGGLPPSDSADTWSGFSAGTPILLSDKSVSGGLARFSVPVVGGYRAAYMSTVGLIDARVRLSGVKIAYGTVVGGPVEPGGIIMRVQDISTYYLARTEIRSDNSVVCFLYNPSGTLLDSATVAGLTHAPGKSYEVLCEITGDMFRVKVWDSAGVEPGAWSASGTDSTLLLPGGVGILAGVNPSNGNTMPFVSTYDSFTVYADLHGGWVPAWVGRSDLSGKFRSVPISSKGSLYRALPATGTPAEVSPWRRTITARRTLPQLLAYWPCEDEATSSQVASALPGAPAMTVSGTVVFAEETMPPGTTTFDAGQHIALSRNVGGLGVVEPGSKPMLSLSTGGAGAGGKLTGTVARTGASSPIEWSVCWVSRSNVLQYGAEILLMEWATPGGTYVLWRLYHQLVGGTLDKVTLFGIDSSGTGVVVASWAASEITLTEYRIEAIQTGTGVATVRLWVNGIEQAETTGVAATLARVTTVTANPLAVQVTGTSGLFMGHIQVWDTASPPNLTGGDWVAGVTDAYGETVWPFWRWQNEAADARLPRLSTEDDMALFVHPISADLVTRMGPQPDGIAPDLYRECERTDGGVLYERPFALGYVPRGAIYSQPAALALSTTDLAEAPAPDDTSQRFRNRFVVKRPTGSSAVAESAELQAGQEVAYEDTGGGDLNTSADAVLLAHASWRLHIVNYKGLLWPRLEIDLWTAAHLLDQWLNCRATSRVTVADPPADVAGQDIDLILEGAAVTLGHKSFAITASLSPAQPWHVGIWSTDRWDSPASSLDASFAAGVDTSMSVAVADGYLWTHADGDFDINAGGVRLTVVGTAGVTSPQTLIVLATPVNGITKTIPAGAPVSLWDPAVYGL